MHRSECVCACVPAYERSLLHCTLINCMKPPFVSPQHTSIILNCGMKLSHIPHTPTAASVFSVHFLSRMCVYALTSVSTTKTPPLLICVSSDSQCVSFPHPHRLLRRGCAVLLVLHLSLSPIQQTVCTNSLNATLTLSSTTAHIPLMHNRSNTLANLSSVHFTYVILSSVLFYKT